MKKLLILLVLIAIFAIGYVLGGGNNANIPGERDFQDIRTSASVRTAFALNKHLDGSQIDVAVRNDALELSGSVASPGHRLLAEEIAASVATGHHVTNLLDVDPALAAGQETSSDRSLGQRLDDLTATARIHTALALHSGLRDSDISVSVRQGMATLDGTVPTWATRELAGKVVEDVEGVQTLRNELVVAPPGGHTADGQAPNATPESPAPDPVRERMTDGSIRVQVEAALNVNPFIDARRIHVEVERAHVTLRGTVDSDADRDLIRKIAEDCWGVVGVTNNLTVSPPKPMQYAPPAAAARQPVRRNG